MFSTAKLEKLALLFLACICYLELGYFFSRTQFELLFSLYTTLFVLFIFQLTRQENDSKDLFKLAIFFRAVFLFATPFLSQDFYRFIWDGHTILNGINPYQYKPNDIINSIATFPNAQYLYEKMGTLSAAHFSNYPPINQLFFAVSSLIGGKSIVASTIVLRCIIIAADIGIYHYGQKILLFLNQNPNKIYWYLLNPLVIIELTGNLHFEGVMLLSFIAGLYYLIKNKYVIVAVFISISIAVKLLPLLLLPLFLKYLGLKKTVIFYVLIIGFNLLLFLPFLNASLIDNYTATIALWFTNFEFNASIYYLLREIGYYVTGYNMIHTIGKITPIITIIITLYFGLIKKNSSLIDIVSNSLLVLSLYFFISTTIHPWYLVNLVLLTIFTNYKFPIAWSFAVILSYYAYSVIPFKENMLLIIAEYLAVYAVFFYEWRKYAFIRKSNS